MIGRCNEIGVFLAEQLNMHFAKEEIQGFWLGGEFTFSSVYNFQYFDYEVLMFLMKPDNVGATRLWIHW